MFNIGLSVESVSVKVRESGSLGREISELWWGIVRVSQDEDCVRRGKDRIDDAGARLRGTSVLPSYSRDIDIFVKPAKNKRFYFDRRCPFRGVGMTASVRYPIKGCVC